MSDIRANTISDAAGTGPIDLHKQSAATTAIRFTTGGGYVGTFTLNVSSTSDDGTGRTTVNCSSGYANTVFAANATALASAQNARTAMTYGPTTSSLSVYTWHTSTGAVGTSACMSIRGDLA